MQGTRTRPKVVVAGGARGVVGHAGTRLLTDLADKAGLTSGFVQALGLDQQRRPAHEPGRVAVDLAVLLADGGEAIADLAVLRQQPGLFGPVASDPTAWRVLDSIDTAALVRLRAARAAARELAWLQLIETRRSLPATTVLGRVLPGFVLDIDATIVLSHSEKEAALVVSAREVSRGRQAGYAVRREDYPPGLWGCGDARQRPATGASQTGRDVASCQLQDIAFAVTKCVALSFDGDKLDQRPPHAGHQQ